MAEIVEVIHRINYEVNDVALIKQMEHIAGLIGQLDKVQTAAGKTKTSLSQIGSGIMQGLGLGGGLAGVAATATNAMKELAMECVKAGIAADRVKQAFDKLNQPGLLGELRIATRGTVTDMELMRTALYANKLHVPVQHLADIFLFARKRASETGEEVVSLTRELVQGIGARSVESLRSLGVSTEKVGTEFSKTQDFAASALKVIAEESKRSGTELDSLADKADRISTRFENFKANMGKWLGDVGTFTFNALMAPNPMMGGNPLADIEQWLDKYVHGEERLKAAGRKLFAELVEKYRKDYLITDDAKGYYAHMLGRLPISVAGGEWNTQGYYDSYFSKAKAAADDFISSYSAAQMVDKEASHPFIVEASTDCEECSGHGHVQRECAACPTGLELVTCKECHGSGQVSRNPGQRIIIPHEKMSQGAPVQIINPDVSINTHHREVCAQIMSLVVEALHLQKADEAQSGVAKAIDQERLYKFISNISNHIFDKLLYDTLGDILAYRNVATVGGQVYPAAIPFRIIKPTQFRIKTSADLLTEYSEGCRAGLPSFIRRRMALDFVDKQYSGDAVMKKKAIIITEMDELSVLSLDEVLQLRDAGTVTAAAIIYSRKLPVVLENLIRAYGETWFLNAGFEQVKTEIESEMDELVNVEEVVKTLLN